MKKVQTYRENMAEEIEAMHIICNIQAVQDKIHGNHFKYEEFNANTIEDLRRLQELLVKEWNQYLKNNP